MRPDFHKILVEQPRFDPSAGAKNPKGIRKAGRRPGVEDDGLPERESMRRRWNRSGARKEFNENLTPLRRFLEGSVGRPWNRVHAELCAALDRDNTVQKHVFDHVKDFVSLHVWTEGRRVFERVAWGGGPHELSNGMLYVHPRTGLLRRYVRKEPTRPAPVPTRVGRDATSQFQRLEGLWYVVELGECLQIVAGARLAGARPWVRQLRWSVLPARDAIEPGLEVFRTSDGQRVTLLADADERKSLQRCWLIEAKRLQERYGNERSFGVSKRQAGSRLLKQHGLRNEPAD